MNVVLVAQRAITGPQAVGEGGLYIPRLYYKVNSKLAGAITQKTRKLPRQHVPEQPNEQGNVCGTDLWGWCGQESLHDMKLCGGLKAVKALEAEWGTKGILRRHPVQQRCGDKVGKVLIAGLRSRPQSSSPVCFYW